ncbi:MAG TPA: heme exporter protein CcmD [Rhodanobacteraceae bacterium]|nr:heme exporter protein CcmD [Rhodanobacteraceae bacterium]
MMHWLAMGGYAMYVWPAYAVFFAVLAWDWLAPAMKRRRLTRELRGRIAREQSRKTRTPRAEASA